MMSTVRIIIVRKENNNDSMFRGIPKVAWKFVFNKIQRFFNLLNLIFDWSEFLCVINTYKMYGLKISLMITVRIIILRKYNDNNSMFLYTIKKIERPSKYVCIKTEYIYKI